MSHEINFKQYHQIIAEDFKESRTKRTYIVANIMYTRLGYKETKGRNE